MSKHLHQNQIDLLQLLLDDGLQLGGINCKTPEQPNMVNSFIVQGTGEVC